MVEVIVDLFQPKLMSQIVDEGVLAGKTGIIVTTGLLMLLLAVISGIAGVGAAGFASTASQNFGNDLRTDAFTRMMSFSLEQTDKFTTGSLITRLTNDITSVQDFVSMSLRMFVRAPLMFIGGIVMALSLNIKFGLVLICALPIQLILLWFILSKARPLFSVVQKKLDKINSIVRENVIGARVVKAFVKEDYESNRFSTANNELMDSTIKVRKLMAVLNPFLMIVMNISVLFIIYLGSFQVEARTMQVGQVMAAITYITQILSSIMMVSMMFQSISRAKASALRITEVLDTEPEIKNGNIEKSTDSGSVEFDNVSFHYPGGRGEPVLKNISLEIKKGETVAILGATGSGKTTLAGLIPRFYDVTEGKILIDDVNVRDYNIQTLRSKIGFVLQKSELFSDTIENNIRWGNEDASFEDVKTAAEIAQADEFIRHFKDGYKTEVSEKGMSLSGGQKQRIAIARAIIKNPEILIFDDSTSALDLGTEARLAKALKEKLSETTIIKIAQRVASVISADKIAIIENGCLAGFDSHENLIKTNSVYIDIYNSQIKKEDRVYE